MFQVTAIIIILIIKNDNDQYDLAPLSRAVATSPLSGVNSQLISAAGKDSTWKTQIFAICTLAFSRSEDLPCTQVGLDCPPAQWLFGSAPVLLAWLGVDKKMEKRTIPKFPNIGIFDLFMTNKFINIWLSIRQITDKFFIDIWNKMFTHIWHQVEASLTQLEDGHCLQYISKILLALGVP